MNQIRIIIEKSKDHYSAYAENVAGIYGAGDTPEEAKQSVVDAITLLKQHNKPKNVPAILQGSYELVFKFDTESKQEKNSGLPKDKMPADLNWKATKSNYLKKKHGI